MTSYDANIDNLQNECNLFAIDLTYDFDGLTLQAAVFETLQNRSTPYEKNSFSRVSALADDTDMKAKWKYFLKKIKDSDLEFAAVIELMVLFLESVYDSILTGNKRQKTWSSKELTWKSL